MRTETLSHHLLRHGQSSVLDKAVHAKIQECANGVKKLEVELTAAGLVIRGCAPTYHLRQRAEEAARAIVRGSHIVLLDEILVLD